MNTRIRRYNLCWLLLVTIALLLSACQTADPLAQRAVVQDPVQVQSSTPTSAERGQDLFRTNCAVCHGDNGERGANPLKNAAGQLEDAALTETILNGAPELGMPAQKKLTNEQIADLVAFIRSWNSQ